MSRVDGFSTATEIGLITGMGDDVMPLLARLFSLGALVEPPPGVAVPAAEPPKPPPAPAPPPRPNPTPTPGVARAEPTTSPSSAGSLSSVPPPPRYPEAELAEEVDIEPERKVRILELFYSLEELSHYEVLGVDLGAEKKQIKAAYYALAQEFHPDRYFRKNVGAFKVKLETIFKRVTEAHDVLTRNQTRSAYDAELAKRSSERPRKAVKLNHQSSRHLPASKSSTSMVPPAAPATPAPTPAALTPAPAAATPPPAAAPTPAPAAAVPPARASSSPALTPPKTPLSAAPTPAAGSPTIPPPDPADASDGASRTADSDQDRRRVLAGRLSGRWGASRSVPPAPPSTTPPPASPAEAANARETLRRIAVTKQIEQQRGQIERYVGTAEECIRRNDPVGAANAYRLALSLDPNNEQLKGLVADWGGRAAATMAEHYSRQGDAESASGRWLEAARSYVRATTGRPDDAPLLDKTARALVRAEGDLHLAADLARRAVALRPQQAGYRVTLAEVYVAANLMLNARRELAEASKVSPDDERVKALLKKLG